MGKGTQIELPDEVKLQRHKQYIQMFRGGLSASAIALAAIKREETYVCDGYVNFRDFVQDELHIGTTIAEVLANCGPLFSLLEDSPDQKEVLEAITAAEQLRPIHKMVDKKTGGPERQLRVLQQAISEAQVTPSGRPLLTGKLVEQVASRHFNWHPKKKKPKEGDDVPAGKKKLEKAFQEIAECGLTPKEAVETYGNFGEWACAEKALEFMRLAKRASK